MAWVAVASTAVGAGLQAYNQHNQPSGAPPPNALPGPTSPGSIVTDNSVWRRDPVTGQITQSGINFDPSGMGAKLDAESMWNSFMGRDNSAQTADLDWQIKKLQQDYDRMQTPTGADGKAPIPSQFKGIQPYLDPATGDLAKWTADPDGIKQGKYGEAGQAILDEFMQSTHGQYGNGGFNAWIKDNINRNVQPQLVEFKKTQEVQGGNATANQKALDDLKNQIEYLTAQKTRITQPGGQSQNPLEKFMTDTGPKWAGTMDNTNPYTDQWGKVTDQKIAGINDDPTADMEKFGLGSGATSYSGQLSGVLNGLGSGQTMGYDALEAGHLDPAAAGRMKDAQDWQTGEEYTNQAKARDAMAARRGMLNSSVSDMQRAGDQSGMIQARLASALGAANMGNDIATKNFGMAAQANQSNNQFAQNAVASNNASELARRMAQIQGLGTLNSQGQQNYQNFLAGKNQSFAQALQSLGAANAMRTEDRNMNVQDWTMGQQENQTGYTRASDMWNRLQAARQQGVANSQNQQGINNQTTGVNIQPQMQLADWQNQSNNANAQMQNAWQMQNAQNGQARANANTNLWGNIASAGLNAYGQYLGQGNTGSSSTPMGYEQYQSAFQLPTTTSQNANGMGVGVTGNWWEPPK